MESFEWGLLVAYMGGAALVGLIVYHAVAGFYHHRYYLKRRDEPEAWKCQPKRFLTPEQHRTAVLVGSSNMGLSGVITGFLAYGVVSGLIETPIYMDVTDYGWAYTLGMTAVLFVLVDCIAYWMHRTFHIRFLFKRFHSFHHRFVATSPYIAVAIHPVEFLCLQAATFVPLFYIPFHAASVVAVLLYVLIYNVVDHSGVRLVSALPWQPPSVYHDDHHAYFHVNFGQHLMIWDRLHGTLRRQNRRYGKEVFGGKGAPLDGRDMASRQLEPYVSY